MRRGRSIVALACAGLATLAVVQSAGAGSRGDGGPPGVTVRLVPDLDPEELAAHPERRLTGPVVHEGQVIGAAPRLRDGGCGAADVPDLEAEVSPGLAYEVVVDVTADCSVVVTDIRTFPASAYDDERSSRPAPGGTLPPQVVPAVEAEAPAAEGEGP